MSDETLTFLVRLALVATALILSLVAHAVVFAILARVTGGVEGSVVKHSRKPIRLLLMLLVILLALPALDLRPAAEEIARQGLALAIIAAVGLTIIALLSVMDEMVTQRYPVGGRDNLTARTIQTRVRVFRSIGIAAVVLLTISTMLMTFPSVRQLGVSLLASAGLATLVVGMAARSTLANLLAGLQIALTQPIRLDDVLVVEGEWGRVEEINTSYAVLRIWDSRTLVIPLAYLVERPIENWTRTGSEILAPVTVYADYGVPVEEVRKGLSSIMKESRYWDGRFWNLQVTDATERSVELRVLMSAGDSNAAWELRCEIRERLIDFLQKRLDEALPKDRVQVSASRSNGVR